MNDGYELAQVSTFHQPLRMDQLIGEAGTTSAGSRMVDKAIKRVEDYLHRDKIACFVAGTLVHTKEGLVPIERIKVGDWVLSKPEGGEGELAYKRVATTYRFEHREVWLFAYRRINPEARSYVDRWVGPIERVAVTGTHPIWFEGMPEEMDEDHPQFEDQPLPRRWMTVQQIGENMNAGFGAIVRLADGGLADVTICEPLLASDRPNVAVEGDEQSLVGGRGYTVTFSADGFTLSTAQTGHLPPVFLEDEDVPVAFCREVFNLEVEDFHTYFVGELGLWVHNADYGNPETAQRRQEKGSGLAPQHHHPSLFRSAPWPDPSGSSLRNIGRQWMNATLLDLTPIELLAAIAARYRERDAAMLAAHRTGECSYLQIGEHFGVHFTTVGRVVRAALKR